MIVSNEELKTELLQRTGEFNAKYDAFREDARTEVRRLSDLLDQAHIEVLRLSEDRGHDRYSVALDDEPLDHQPTLDQQSGHDRYAAVLDAEPRDHDQPKRDLQSDEHPLVAKPAPMSVVEDTSNSDSDPSRTERMLSLMETATFQLSEQRISNQKLADRVRELEQELLPTRTALADSRQQVEGLQQNIGELIVVAADWTKQMDELRIALDLSQARVKHLEAHMQLPTP
jgi:hypothetical protein